MLVENDFGVWQIDLTVDGNRCRKSTRTKDKSLAQKLHALTEAEMLKGSWGLNKPKLTLEKAFEMAIDSHWKGTKAIHKVHLNWNYLVLPRHGNKPILDKGMDVSKVDGDVIRHITAELKKEGNSNATINRKIAVLRTLLNLCNKWGKLKEVPHMGALKEPPSRHRELSEEEESAMIAFFRSNHPYEYPDLIDVYEFLLSSGNRIDEVCKLTRFDVNFNTGLVRFVDTKAGTTKFKPMTSKMRGILERRRGSPKPFPESRITIDRWWRKFRSHMGYGHDKTFVVHSLRHTCASRLVARGVDLKRVQLWMFHESIETTMKYAQLNPKYLKDVAKVLDVVKVIEGGVEEFDYSLSTDSQTDIISNPAALLQVV